MTPDLSTVLRAPDERREKMLNGLVAELKLAGCTAARIMSAEPTG